MTADAGYEDQVLWISADQKCQLQVVELAGPGSIVRVMTDRRTVWANRTMIYDETAGVLSCWWG